MAKRSRADCTPENLASIITPFVNGRRFLSYAENPNSKVQRMIIMGHKGLIQQVMNEYKTLGLAATVTESAFLLVADDIGDKIGLKAEHKKDWARTMSKRLRTMFRHTAQRLVTNAGGWTSSSPLRRPRRR